MILMIHFKKKKEKKRAFSLIYFYLNLILSLFLSLKFSFNIFLSLSPTFPLVYPSPNFYFGLLSVYLFRISVSLFLSLPVWQ